ncbi:Type II secretion system protein E [compost metagenome]
MNSQIGLSFAASLRSILRQDPNIVMVGEIRDSETAEIAVRASLTGHMVLSTIHTNSAVSTISRLIDMGIDPYLIASSLSCIVAQRLVRRVCRECGEIVPAREDERKLLQSYGLMESQKLAEAVGVGFFRREPAEPPPIMLTRGKGCGACNKTGYSGRLAVHEVLAVDESLRRLIAQNRPVSEIETHLAEDGFKTMMYDGLSKVKNGLTTTDEVLKAVSDE